MFKEFTEDLGPWTLRAITGFALSSILAALVSFVVLPILGGEVSSLGLHIAAGALLLGLGTALGAWVQARLAPARMYRYSKQLAPLLKCVRDEPDPVEQVRDAVDTAGHFFQVESKVSVVFAVLELSGPCLSVSRSSAPGELDRGLELPADGRLKNLQHLAELQREDNLKRQAGKVGFPSDHRTLFDLDFRSLRALPVSVNGNFKAILLLVSKKPRAFTAAEDRILDFLADLLAMSWGQGPAPAAGSSAGTASVPATPGGSNSAATPGAAGDGSGGV